MIDIEKIAEKSLKEGEELIGSFWLAPSMKTIFKYIIIEIFMLRNKSCPSYIIGVTKNGIQVNYWRFMKDEDFYKTEFFNYNEIAYFDFGKETRDVINIKLRTTTRKYFKGKGFKRNNFRETFQLINPLIFEIFAICFVRDTIILPVISPLIIDTLKSKFNIHSQEA